MNKSYFTKVKQMNKLLLFITILMSLACGGGGGNQPTKQVVSSTNDITLGEEPYGEVKPYKNGVVTYSIPSQKTVITSARDYEFFYRMLTGEDAGDAKEVIAISDILMIVYTTKQFNIDNVTVTTSTNTINIYYYETDIEDIEDIDAKYQLYILDKTKNPLNYIEIVKL